MATLRGSQTSYDIGNAPPTVIWTVVRGDTSGFRVYATDDAKVALNIPDWTISMKIKRPNSVANLGVITDDATTVCETSTTSIDLYSLINDIFLNPLFYVLY